MIKPALLLGSAALVLTPADLLTKLLETPIKAAELPAGFSKPEIARQPLTANGKKYHAVGQVAVLVQGPDAEDAFAWEAFKTHANAIADLDHPVLTAHTKIVDTVPGYKESLLLAGTLSGKRVYDAVTVVDTVLVQGVTVSARGNKAGAIALLRAAVKHLQRVRG
ncbi:MAG TPA: hypothetical protein VLE97_03540 [Gaiellaceae bacterium]|nr:hypothetical protein [Gaiellaceae bacterium]